MKQEVILPHAASEQATNAGRLTSPTSSCTLQTCFQCLMGIVEAGPVAQPGPHVLQQSGRTGQAAKGPICNMEAIDFFCSPGG